MTVTVKIIELSDDGPSASVVVSQLDQAFHNLAGIKVEVQAKELRCNCSSHWPSYCEYHNKRYGF